jgi:hypothetical protein
LKAAESVLNLPNTTIVLLYHAKTVKLLFSYRFSICSTIQSLRLSYGLASLTGEEQASHHAPDQAELISCSHAFLAVLSTLDYLHPLDSSTVQDSKRGHYYHPPWTPS